MAGKKSSDYWKKRFELIEQSQNQQGVQCYAELEKKYRQAQRQIEIQIQAWYGRFASNNGISIQDARKMLAGRELAELKWDVNEYIKHGEENALSGTWVKELENASARYHISRLEALKLQTQQQLEVLFGNQLDSIDSAMKSIYTSGYYHTAYEIQKGFGVGWDFATLDEKQINKIINTPWAADGQNFSSRIWKNKQKLVNELNTTLTQNIILGQDPQKAIDKIAKAMNTSKTNAGRLVMTEEAFFSSAAQKDCFNELDVEMFEIVATLDSHTSEICQEMDGKVFPMSQWEVGVTAPPFHVWCRTTTVPAFGDEFDNIGERAARGADGKTYYVPADMTYKQWQKSFVEGDKTDLQEIKPLQKPDEVGNIARTEKEFEQVANNVKVEITNYSSNPSKWSGIIHTRQDLIDGGAVGMKEWSCDISIMDIADDGVVWHEMLHSCSASYYNPMIYVENEFIEEASVEFLKLQICAEKEIPNIAAYEDKVTILQAINNAFSYGTDLEFAKELFNIPLPDRYQWLKDKVDDSLRVASVSFQDYNDVMQFLENLKGGRHGTNK